MGRASREKGKRGERELASRLNELGVHGAARGQQYRGGGDSPDVVGVPGVHVECKRVERLDLQAAMAQSVRDAEGTGDVPVVMHRRDREEWLVTMSLDDWAAMYLAANPVVSSD